MKENERRLLLALYSGKKPYEAPGNVKQNAYYCTKWTTKGWYNWGTNVLCGWLEPRGKEVAAQLLTEVKS